MESQNAKGMSRTTHFLVGSFIFLLLISIGAFSCLGYYMSRVSEDSISKVGDLYMEGINERVTAHFRTLIDLKLEQVETIVQIVPAEEKNLYEELVYRARIRNFNYLALCSEEGVLEMLDGEQVELADPEPFYTSLKNHEKKVAVGKDQSGNEVVLFGVDADYPMKDGGISMALIAAIPIEYISTMLGTEEENVLIFSNIIRDDGSFIVSDMDDDYPDYFAGLHARYQEDDKNEIDRYIRELSDAMKSKESYSAIMNFGESNQQIYCTPLPYSEWNLMTVLPFGVLNETLEAMNKNRTVATMIICGIVLLVLLTIFYIYYKMTRQQMRDLDQARREALVATEAKSTFLSNMSHDVLDMSKIESGKMTLTAEQISLQEVVEGVVGIVQAQVKAKSQNFNVHIDKIMSEEVYCDSVRLNQVLLNLLSNAVKYTQEGGTIQLYLFQEKEAPEGKEGYVRTHIVVQDNGIGMTKEFMAHVFDSYSRADSKRVHKTEGAGLGMAITKHIIDTMEGTITVESTQGKGTRFQVILDLEKAQERELEMVLPAWKMLVVDDDETLCHTAVEALDSIGIQADWTLSGEKALEMVRRHHQMRDDYQIVLLDWKLPGMDGLSVARQIRKIVDTEMPIILISAYDWNDFEVEAREAGINGFISKPLFRSTLYHGLKKYMNIEEASDGIKEDSDLAGRHILVAEDNELNWEILRELLMDLGMELEWAENGKICLENFEKSKKGDYDAILMDVRMPVMNGYEATRAIRALERPDAQTIPIIAMTADAFSEDIKKCLDSGMNAHTAKPINMDEVVSLLKKFL